MYLPQTDDIYLPGHFLGFPYYVETLPTWFNLGGIGYVLGHEIGHAIERFLRQVPSDYGASGDTSGLHTFVVGLHTYIII